MTTVAQHPSTSENPGTLANPRRCRFPGSTAEIAGVKPPSASRSTPTRVRSAQRLV